MRVGVVLQSISTNTILEILLARPTLSLTESEYLQIKMFLSGALLQTWLNHFSAFYNTTGVLNTTSTTETDDDTECPTTWLTLFTAYDTPCRDVTT